MIEAHNEAMAAFDKTLEERVVVAFAIHEMHDIACAAESLGGLLDAVEPSCLLAVRRLFASHPSREGGEPEGATLSVSERTSDTCAKNAWPALRTRPRPLRAPSASKAPRRRVVHDERRGLVLDRRAPAVEVPAEDAVGSDDVITEEPVASFELSARKSFRKAFGGLTANLAVRSASLARSRGSEKLAFFASDTRAAIVRRQA